MKNEKTYRQSSHFAPTIQLPQSPLWGWALLAVMLALVAGGIFLIMSGSKNISPLGGGCVARISIDGEIFAQGAPDSLFSSGQAGSEEISKMVEDADKRDDVRAILVEINSPGGSVVGSHEIYMALKNAKKPKVAYFREEAASGGYYVAMGTDYIVSEPDALTGSIGARATLSDMSGLFAKVGYNETTIKSGELKDIGNPARPMTDKEKEILQGIVNESFMEFRDIVVENRKGKLNMNEFESQVLDARVLTGRQAYKLGLVDQVGSKNDAIKKASGLGGSNDSLEICEIGQKQKSFLGQLLSGSLESILPKMQDGLWHLYY